MQHKPKNTQLLKELYSKVQVVYSKPQAKKEFAETEYCVGDSVFYTLAAAQKHAEESGELKVGRVLGDTIVRWWGKINYKSGTIEWIRREEKV